MRSDEPHGGWTLTEWEWLGLRRDINLADGHAHYRLSRPFSRALTAGSALLADLESIDQNSAERDLITSFSRLTGQSLRCDEACLHYSSSVSIEMCAKVICELGLRTVGLITPTFDNIPLLLRRTGLDLVAVDEDELWHPGDVVGQIPPCDALFVVVPNNPTGKCPTARQMLALMETCAASGRVLVCDFSFRLYSDYHLWDQYEAARAIPGLDFLFIEDTGKAYPLSEMKVGLATASRKLRETLRGISDELLLNASPFILSLLSEVMKVDLHRNGSAADRKLEPERIVGINRRRLQGFLNTVREPGFLECYGSRLSVAWLRIGGGSSSEVCASWAAAGVVTLPGRPFFWDDPERGESFIRIALARSPSEFSIGMSTLTRIIGEGGSASSEP